MKKSTFWYVAHGTEFSQLMKILFLYTRFTFTNEITTLSKRIFTQKRTRNIIQSLTTRKTSIRFAKHKRHLFAFRRTHCEFAIAQKRRSHSHKLDSAFDNRHFQTRRKARRFSAGKCCLRRSLSPRNSGSKVCTFSIFAKWKFLDRRIAFLFVLFRAPHFSEPIFPATSSNGAGKFAEKPRVH